MSNARSPREVCSTTIGTSGLMRASVSPFRSDSCRDSRREAAAAPDGSASAETVSTRWCPLFRSGRASGARRPELGGLVGALLFGRPDRLARLCLSGRNRLRRPHEQVHRLAHGDVLAQHLGAPVLANLRERALELALARWLRVRARRRLAQRLEQLLVADLDALGGDDRGERALATQRPLGLGLRLADQLLLVLARELKVLLGVDPLAREAPRHLLPELVRLGVHELVRDLDRGALNRRVDDRLAELVLDRLLVALDQPPAQVVAQLGERVEPARLERQVVVGLGQALLLDLAHGDREDRLAAGEALGVVAVREGHSHLALLARACTGEPLLEAFDELARAELEQMAARLSALELLSVDRADEVDAHEVALPRRPVDGLEPGLALAQALDLRAHRLVGGFGLAPADLDSLVLAELGDRTHADLEREGERRALGGQLGDVDARIADHREGLLTHRLAVPAGEGAANRLVEHGRASHALEHHGRRHLSLAEARHLHVAGERGRGALELALDRPRLDLDVDAHARVGKLLPGRRDRRRHGGPR